MSDITAEEATKIAADTAAQAEQTLSDVARRIETALREGLAELRDKSRDYADVAGEGFETAQQYVVDRVQERPVAATLTALGVGVVIGVLLAGRRR
jgi:ElaB/YqjD/DUF883 family membrane-anchored ribosome-binding protein